MADIIVDEKVYELQNTSEASTGRDYENQITFGNTSRVDTSVLPVEEAIYVYGNNLKIKRPWKMGNCYTFWFLRDQPRIVIGPQCKDIQITLVYMSMLLISIICAISAFLTYVIYPHVHITLKYIGNTIFLTQLISQCYTTLVNPGIPNRNNYVSQGVMETIYRHMRHNDSVFEKYRVCKECNILVKLEQSVMHCEDCNICVEGKTG
jgi:hypothetical protein